MLEIPKDRLLPGEADAITTAQTLGGQYGYGNLIYHLREAWSKMLQEKHGMSRESADMAAGHVCVWCNTDSRIGQKRKKRKMKKTTTIENAIPDTLKKLKALEEAIETRHRIRCRKCENTDEFNEGDGMDAAAWFSMNGWTVARGRVKCPEC